jgi:hypothetical protein
MSETGIVGTPCAWCGLPIGPDDPWTTTAGGITHGQGDTFTEKTACWQKLRKEVWRLQGIEQERDHARESTERLAENSKLSHGDRADCDRRLGLSLLVTVPRQRTGSVEIGGATYAYALKPGQSLDNFAEDMLGGEDLGGVVIEVRRAIGAPWGGRS